MIDWRKRGNRGIRRVGGIDESGQPLDDRLTPGTGEDFSLDVSGLTTDARTGTACMQLKVLNAANEANGSEIQQNTANVNSALGAVTPGKTYRLSFWAKQISSGVSYVQQFKVSFLDNTIKVVYDTLVDPKKFYRVGKLP